MEELLGGILSNEAVFLGPMNSGKIGCNLTWPRFHSSVVTMRWTKVKDWYKTGSAKSLSLTGKWLHRNDETYKKYIDSAVSYILGPSCLTPVQIPAHHVTLQGGDTNQLVNAHNTHNGNPGNTTPTCGTINLSKAQDDPMPTEKIRQAVKFAETISQIQKEGYGRDGRDRSVAFSDRVDIIQWWRRSSAKGQTAERSKGNITQSNESARKCQQRDRLWPEFETGLTDKQKRIVTIAKQWKYCDILLNLTCTWSKFNLDMYSSNGGKIIEKANGSGNTENSEIHPFTKRKDHTTRNSYRVGLNSILLGDTSQGPNGWRQLSTGSKQDLPSSSQSTIPSEIIWKKLDWNSIGEEVEEAQKALVTLVGEKGKYSKEVAKLQIVLAKTLSFRASAVHKATSNQGGRTPGYDGIVLDTPDQKGEMIKTLRDTLITVEKRKKYQTVPVRRVTIPKANGKLRPLGIPTIKDRCLQQLLNLVLAPVVEKYSDPNSFGFRPYRGAKNAIAAVRTNIQSGREWKWILDADIKGFFDNIDHGWIMKNIPMPATHKTILEGWLKSGAIQKTGRFDPWEEFIETIAGTPQGSLISPTIANFVLEGLEDCIRQSISKVTGSETFRKNIYKDGKRTKMLTFHLKTVRYADDFIVMANSRRIIELMVKPAVTQFLKERGVSLSEEKTKIYSIGSGEELNFLGYTFKYRRVWKFKHSFFKERLGKSGIALYPNKKKLASIKAKLKGIFRSSSNLSAYELISRVNPIIRGWANYFNLGESIRYRAHLRLFLFKECWRWAHKKHPKWGKKSIATTYFLDSPKAGKEMALPGTHKWAFHGVTRKTSRYSEKDTGKERTMVDPTTVVETVAGRTFAIPKNLLHIHGFHEDIQKVIEFQTKANFKSLGKYTGLKGKLSIRQKGNCPICNKSLFKDELGNTDVLSFNNLEIDHIKPISKGGPKSHLQNLRLLHRACHRKLTQNTSF